MFGSIVRKQDIIVAKNYLNESEIDILNRLTTLFLESAELRVKERKDLTLDFWRNNVNGLLTYHGKDILQGKGSLIWTYLFQKQIFIFPGLAQV